LEAISKKTAGMESDQGVGATQTAEIKEIGNLKSSMLSLPRL